MHGTRIIIPHSLRPEVLRLAHEGHEGIVKMKNRLQAKVWWPKMDRDAEQVCKNCHGCQVVREFLAPEPMQWVEPPSGSWQHVAIDILGPHPSRENLLVVVDYYSRYFEVVIMHSTSSQKMVKALAQIFTRYGYPVSLKSDNASQFYSFLTSHGIQHRTSSPLCPRANGEVE